MSGKRQQTTPDQGEALPGQSKQEKKRKKKERKRRDTVAQETFDGQSKGGGKRNHSRASMETSPPHKKPKISLTSTADETSTEAGSGEGSAAKLEAFANTLMDCYDKLAAVDKGHGINGYCDQSSSPASQCMNLVLEMLVEYGSHCIRNVIDKVFGRTSGSFELIAMKWATERTTRTDLSQTHQCLDMPFFHRSVVFAEEKNRHAKTSLLESSVSGLQMPQFHNTTFHLWDSEDLYKFLGNQKLPKQAGDFKMAQLLQRSFEDSSESYHGRSSTGRVSEVALFASLWLRHESPHVTE